MTQQISRRAFVTGALSTFPYPAFAALPTNPDVIVIGAGSAGLAASKTLLSMGKSVVVIEAAGRIGGRAFTESETFGVPFDHGCSWITAPHNPYAEMAKDGGFELRNHTNPGEAFYVGNRRANAAERKKYDQSWAKVQGALSKAGREGLDVSAASVIPEDLEYSGISQSWIGAMDWGVDFKNLSTRDNWESADANPNYMVKEGHGALVARLGAGLPIKLNAPATRIDWSGNGVAVETPQGTLRAKTCIVTVSTGVLGASAIKFTPSLPTWKQQAVDDLPMGLLAKITLQFDGERMGFTSDNWLTYWVRDQMPAKACYFLTWPFDFDLMIGFIGGAFGWELSKAGPEVAIDFALGEVVKIAGSKARDHFVKGHLTGWADNPLTLGAYAAARPGRYGAREELARPLGDRVLFAGEAMAGPYVALCGGAYMSGEAVAKKVAALI
ncbi:MAG: FAD-dependent oxidoreductase [Rhodobacteraceae bacterium]|nr:FAD-dependent oxidoreductase [Paracoccaceae bacterium]